MLELKDIQQNLQQFTGTNQYYRNRTGDFNYTDGIQWLAKNAECYWLIDLIASYQITLRKLPKNTNFQLWILVTTDEHKVIKRRKDHQAVVECWADTPIAGQLPLVRKHIPFTDFPLPEIKLYLENGVLMLPSER